MVVLCDEVYCWKWPPSPGGLQSAASDDDAGLLRALKYVLIDRC